MSDGPTLGLVAQEDSTINQINEINQNTFKNIANSLSPEPEKLFQQQLGIAIDQLPQEKKASLLAKRPATPLKSIYEVVEPPSVKRQKRD